MLVGTLLYKQLANNLVHKVVNAIDQCTILREKGQ